MKRLVVTTVIMVLGMATASAAPRDRNAVPEATPDGKPVSCIQASRIESTRVHGDSVIDFHMSGGKVYRNVLPFSCPSLGFEERFLHKSTTNDYCSVDIITVLQSPGLSEGPSCGLGTFQPVKIVKVAAR